MGSHVPDRREQMVSAIDIKNPCNASFKELQARYGPRIEESLKIKVSDISERKIFPKVRQGG